MERYEILEAEDFFGYTWYVVRKKVWYGWKTVERYSKRSSAKRLGKYLESKGAYVEWIIENDNEKN